MNLLPSTAHDALFLARNLRASDVRETEFLARATDRFVAGWSVEADLRRALEIGRQWSFWHGDKLAGMGGVTPVLGDGTGAAWFLGTPIADRHWREMTHACRRVLRIEGPRFHRMGNIVPAHMKKRIRWLEFLGFDISKNEAQVPLNGYVAFWSQSG